MSQFSINKGEINKKIKKLFVIRLPSSNTKDLGCDIIKELNILSPYKRMFFFFITQELTGTTEYLSL